MGNWKNRPHRRFFYRQQRAPPSYSFDYEPSSSGFCNDGIPLWEKKFCASIGKVPWKKVVDTQKFMYNDNVLNWDDSAGKEAFQNAKERFWAHINDFPCQISLPDPGIYIDEIDWNPHIDPELVRDLESVYFAPDDGEKDPKVWRRLKRLRNMAAVPKEECNGNSGCINPREWSNIMGVGGTLKDEAQIGKKCDNSNSDTKNGHNPWESSFTKGNDVLGDKIQGWKQWDDNSNNNDDNPWEHSCSQGNGPVQKSTWGNSGDKLWGWNQGADHGNLFRNCNNGGNPWERNCWGVDPVKNNKGWGESWNNSQCWSQQKSWKRDRGENPWNPKFSKNTRPPKDMGLRDCRGKWRENVGDSRGWKQWDSQNNEPKHLEFERSGGNWGARDRSCQKREGPHLSSYKSSRYQQDYNQSGQMWSKNANKRVKFCT